MLNRFTSNARKLNRVVPKINVENLINADLTGSLLNIEIPIKRSFNSNTKANPNPIKVVNNKNTINNFHLEILQNSSRYIQRQIDSFDNTGFGSLIINNVTLDYGTEGVNVDNFEVLVYGLQIPGDYSIRQIENNVVVILNNEYIDFDSVTINDIYVIGKLVDIPIATENDSIIITESGLDIII